MLRGRSRRLLVALLADKGQALLCICIREGEVFCLISSYVLNVLLCNCIASNRRKRIEREDLAIVNSSICSTDSDTLIFHGSL